MNTIDYIQEVQYDSFYDRPYGEIDYLLLAELSYLPFDTFVIPSWDLNQAQRLSDLEQQIPLDPSPLMRERYQLLHKMAHSKRYKNLKLLAFQNIIEPQNNLQFSAVTFCIAPKTYVLAFRGTDDSLVGWKEDLLMSYQEEIPAQILACHYLTEALTELEGDIDATGHSKGGNLAIYAASHLTPLLSKKLKSIYSFDAPGLHTSVLDSQGYQRISHKIKRYIPENSVVGVFLYSQAPTQIIKSSVQNGMRQHNTFTWEIEEHAFSRAPGLSTSSQQLEQTMAQLVEEVPDAQLAQIIQTFFSLMEHEGITSINIFFQKSAWTTILKILQRGQSLSSEQWKPLLQFAQLVVQVWQETKREWSSIKNQSEN